MKAGSVEVGGKVLGAAPKLPDESAFAKTAVSYDYAERVRTREAKVEFPEVSKFQSCQNNRKDSKFQLSNLFMILRMS